MPKETQDINTENQEQSITLAHGSRLIAPSSWVVEMREDYVEMISPEQDITLYFLEIPLLNNVNQVTSDAWMKVGISGSSEPSMNLPIPMADGWEESHHFMYDTPTSESRFMAALVRTFKQYAYVCLVNATMAGLSRRAAQLQIINDNWTPMGFKKPSLKGLAPKKWTELEIKEFEQFILSSMQLLKVPGLSIAIIQKNGQMLYQNAFGVKQLGVNDPVTVDTPFMIGSTTKALTTLLMARLVDQKKLNWDTRVKDTLPEFYLADQTLTEQLTIRHTVSASTGMPRRDLDWIFKYKDVTPEERLAQMRHMKPTTKLGETFQYSNYLVMAGGYAAAICYAPGDKLENAYAIAMQELIFKPLRMNHTALKIEDAMQLGAAKPHGTTFNGKLCEIPLEWENSVHSVAPAGAIWSTAHDLCQYLLLEMNSGVFAETRVIAEEPLKERRKPGIKMGANMYYGLGLILAEEQGLDSIGHGGATLGFSSDLAFFPDLGIGFSLLANARYSNMLLYAIKQKWLELSFDSKALAADSVQVAVKAQEAMLKKNLSTISLSPEYLGYLDELLGDYSCGTLGELKLYRDDKDQSYWVECEEWHSRVGIEIETSDKKVIVLVDGPFPGHIKFLIPECDASKLILDAGQDQHEFFRKPKTGLMI